MAYSDCWVKKLKDINHKVTEEKFLPGYEVIKYYV